jgi:hypothetical protein
MRHNARRNNRNGKQGNSNNKKPSRMRVFDSNGPDVRIRGTAWQVTEKYQALAKDAEASGNWVQAESYWQHAEHYQRIINSFAEETPLDADKPQYNDDTKDNASEDIVVAQKETGSAEEIVAA